ncbi:MAG: outer membrane beta-barrel protein [Bacteroidales bacterium]
MKKILSILIITKLTMTVLLAQMTIVITGRLVDLNNEAVVGADIIIQTVDSVFIGATNSNIDGSFSIKSNTSQCILLVEHISYEPFFLKLGNLNIGTIKLTEAKNALKEVIVSADISVIKKEKGKTIVQVSGSSFQDLGDISEILRRAPSIQVSENTISVFGKGTPLIYIDDKISSFNEVKLLQPSEIILMEIDRNPSAKYNASYKSVIKIKTKRNNDGISAQIYEQTMFAKKFRNIAGVQIQINRGKWYNYVSYKNSISNSLEYITSVESINKPDYKLLDTIDNIHRTRFHSNNLVYGSRLKLDKRHSLNWQYYMNILSKPDGYFNSSKITEHLYLNDETPQNINVESCYKKLSSSHKLSLGYAFNIDSLSKFEINTDYAYIKNNGEENIYQEYIRDNLIDTIFVDNIAASHVFNLETEYSKSLNAIHFLIGARYGYINGDNSTNYKAKNTSTLLKNNTIGLYVTLGKEYKKWGYDIGLRDEIINDNIIVNDKTIQNNWNNNIFPSIDFHTTKLIKDVELSLTYTSRIRRASISELSPAISYSNSVVIVKGNPFLNSSIIHSVALSSTIWNNLTLGVEYTYLKNPIIPTGVLSEDEKSIVFQPVNINKSNTYTMNISYSNQWKIFTLSVDGNLDFPHAKIPYMDGYIINTGATFYGSISGDLRIAKHTSISGSFQYSSGGYELMTKWDPTYNLSAGITQHFFNKNLMINISMFDILDRSTGGWRDRYGYYETSERGNYDNRYIRIIFRYNFNNFSNKYKTRGNSDIFNRVN